MEFCPLANKQSAKQEPVTLVVPALSIGNVGQLAVDLIISSLQAHKVAYLDDPCVLPCIGNDPFGSIDRGELAVALEVYEGQDDDLRIVQQRAPIIKGLRHTGNARSSCSSRGWFGALLQFCRPASWSSSCLCSSLRQRRSAQDFGTVAEDSWCGVSEQGTMLEFAKNLSVWASTNNTKEVIILSGVDSGKRPMRDVGSSPIRYISTANPDGTDQRCEVLGWKKLEDFLPSSEAWKLLESQSLKETDEGSKDCEGLLMSDEMYYPSLPFASLYSCCKVRGLKALCILFFCSEGDNIQDAFFLGEALQSLFSLNNSSGQRPQAWVVPYSWRSVYGPPPDPTMFC